MSTLVLMERTRVLIFDKITIFRDDYKKILQEKNQNETKTGSLK
jgi:hypothetical protein